MASVSVDGLESPVNVVTVMQWQRKGESDSIFNGITDNTLINNGLMSTLQYDEVISGSVMYQCVSILEGVDNISDHDEITVTVVGESQTTTVCLAHHNSYNSQVAEHPMNQRMFRSQRCTQTVSLSSGECLPLHTHQRYMW